MDYPTIGYNEIAVICQFYFHFYRRSETGLIELDIFFKILSTMKSIAHLLTATVRQCYALLTGVNVR